MRYTPEPVRLLNDLFLNECRTIVGGLVVHRFWKNLPGNTKLVNESPKFRQKHYWTSFEKGG